MSDGLGTFEHADHDQPRLGHGYCTDDVARVLIVVAREPRPSREVSALGRTALGYLAQAQGTAGRIRNRRTAGGRWHGRRGVEDCWGRSLWAFGTAAGRLPDDWMGQSALAYFDHGARARSPWPRAMAFAALGAAEVLAVDPQRPSARALMADAVDAIGEPGGDEAWLWPESRLTYANAALAEALIAAGHFLLRAEVVENGLTMLRWLLERETVDGHFSPTPVGGTDRHHLAPRFDQQPIEVAAMADACARAAAVTEDDSWYRGVNLAIGWFAGQNDAGAVMWDSSTGGGYDGLQASGPNLNQGAESTLALISTLQHARSRLPAPA
jgi:hypothetical protein